jgi:hypothetical protein
MIHAVSSIASFEAINRPTAQSGSDDSTFSELIASQSESAGKTGTSMAAVIPSALTTSASTPTALTSPGLHTYNPVAEWDQTPGQQPAFVTGNYPGATWDTYAGPAGQFLMPYGSISPGPGNDLYTGANMNVMNQDWQKYYTQTDGAKIANQIMWGSNNPQQLVSAPWLGDNPDAQYTPVNANDPSQPTQPNYVSPQMYQQMTSAPASSTTGTTTAAPPVAITATTPPVVTGTTTAARPATSATTATPGTPAPLKTAAASPNMMQTLRDVIRRAESAETQLTADLSQTLLKI